MTKLRFFISMIIALMIYIFMPLVAGLNLILYVDPLSMVLTIIIPYLMVSFVFQPREQWQFTREIFTPTGTGSKKELKRAVIFYKSFKRILVASSLAAVLFGVIGIMTHMDDTRTLGPNFAVVLISPIYTTLFLILVIEPLRLGAEKNLVG